MKYHTYIKFKSLFNDSECRTVSQSKRKRGSVGSSFSVCVSIYCIYRRVTQTFVRSQNEFSEHLSPRTAKLHTGYWGYECVPLATTRGQACVSGRALAPKSRQESRNCKHTSCGPGLFPNGKIHVGMSRFAFSVPLVSYAILRLTFPFVSCFLLPILLQIATNEPFIPPAPSPPPSAEA